MSLERTHIDFTVVAAAVTVVESSLEPTLYPYVEQHCNPTGHFVTMKYKYEY